jgi:hypothetical protein
LNRMFKKKNTGNMDNIAPTANSGGFPSSWKCGNLLFLDYGRFISCLSVP